MKNGKTYRGCDYPDRDQSFDRNWCHPQPSPHKLLSAHAWLEANKDKYPNGCVVSEIMEGYARYYHEQKSNM